MRYVLLTGVSVLAVVLVVACEQQAKRSSPSGPEVAKEAEEADASVGEEEPLRLEDEEPPLLLDDGDEAAPPKGPVADNSRCFVCHLNYQSEELALDHARAGIGCADCHGESDAHIADESWASGGKGTPPEVMYTKDEINPACLKCHPRDEINKALHEAFFAGKTSQKVCTDCHGDHRLPERMTTWK